MNFISIIIRIIVFVSLMAFGEYGDTNNLLYLFLVFAFANLLTELDFVNRESSKKDVDSSNN